MAQTMFFFDLDGTLLDSNGVWLEIDVEFLGRHGVSPVPPDYTDYAAHHSAPDSARYTRERFHLKESPEEIMAAWHDMAREAYARHLPLKPGAAEFLRRCAQAQIPMALITSCMPELCEAALTRHGLTPFFRSVMTTASLGLEKRDPMLYRTAAARFDMEPENCVMFEDSPDYCAAAIRAGFRTVGVFDPLFAHRWKEMLAQCAPMPCVMASYDELDPRILG